MEILGNILWIVLGGGIFIFLQYVASGLAFCASIIGIPFGVQCFKLSIVGLVPFGREIKTRNDFGGGVSLILNVVWLVIGGVWIALTHLLFMVICGITVIGLPFAYQHWKLTKLALFPFGKEIV
jgi:uncharacterized membrane protein YccF (DUF307 family)